MWIHIWNSIAQICIILKAGDPTGTFCWKSCLFLWPCISVMWSLVVSSRALRAQTLAARNQKCKGDPAKSEVIMKIQKVKFWLCGVLKNPMRKSKIDSTILRNYFKSISKKSIFCRGKNAHDLRLDLFLKEWSLRSRSASFPPRTALRAVRGEAISTPTGSPRSASVAGMVGEYFQIFFKESQE